MDRDDQALPAAARELADWLAGYLAELETMPVAPATRPGDVLAQLPAEAPDLGDPRIEPLLADLDAIIVPALLQWQSPRFFGYFPANASTPSMLADLASAGLGTIGMLWATGPAMTELEVRMLDWMADLLGLPSAFRSDGAGGGVIQDSESSAALVAVIAARERVTAGAGNRIGGSALAGLTAYASEQAHSSIEKALRIAGIGSDNLRCIPVDADDALRTDVFEEAIAADLAAGRRPFFVSATVGTTSTLGVDPVPAIADVAQRHDLWLHVDAAMLGVAALLPAERDRILAGADRADSWNTNAHKWLPINFDCSLFWVRDRASLVDALAIHPAYLDNAASRSGTVIDYRDWQIPLGRRFRALKLWFALRWFGAERLRAMLEGHIALARDFADRVVEDDRFELVRPPRWSLVCFRLRGDDEATATLIDRVNASGRAYLTTTQVDGRLIARLAIGNRRTQESHVDQAWSTIAAIASEIDTESR